MNNKLRRKVKKSSFKKYYFFKRKVIQKYPGLKKTINNFWEEIKNMKL